MSRFEFLRPAGLMAFHSLMAAATIAALVWILYCEGWIGVDLFRAGLMVSLLLLAGGLIAAGVVAIAGFLLRDQGPR